MLKCQRAILCCQLWQIRKSTSLQHVAEVAAADNAVYAFPKEEAKLCLLRKCIFPQGIDGQLASWLSSEGQNDMKLIVPESVLGVKEWECEVISNKNVATFIKEFIVALPKGEHMDFLPGSYAQIKIPKYSMDYDKDIDKSLIGDEYLPAWQKFGLFGLKCRNDEETVRAYSMANYPAEGDRIMLTVRIATPPFKPKPQVGFQDVMPGIASSYIFTLKPGDKVLMSGPYGDFHPHFNSKKEMIWVGGGAGMAPLRAQIMHMTRTLNTRDRKMSFFYGARALNEVFYLHDFLELEKEFPNFSFHLALDRPDPAADAAGVKYTAGFVHQVMYETYLKTTMLQKT